MERGTCVRPSLDFRMVSAFKLMVYLDFFQNTWGLLRAFWQNTKEKMKAQIEFLSLLNPERSQTGPLLSYSRM